MKKYIILLLCLLYQRSVIAQVVLKEYNQLIPGTNLYFKMMPIPEGDLNFQNSGKMIHLSSFWMGAFEVTRDEFDAFYDDEQTSQNSKVDAVTRPSPQYVDLTWGMGKEGGYPANSMSQRSALMYCRWLYNQTKIFYRLPTEAEWEYACKAGNESLYYFGNDSSKLSAYAWYGKNSKNVYHKVGQKIPNKWGLYDLLGNMLEWTLDHYYVDITNKLTDKDPLLPANNERYPKVLKGGSFLDKKASDLWAKKRVASDPIWNKRDPQIPKSKWWLTEAKNVGFRLMRPAIQPSENEVNIFFDTYLK